MDRPPSQCGRQPARAIECRQIPSLVVAIEPIWPATDELVPASVSLGFTGGRQRTFGIRPLDECVAADPLRGPGDFAALSIVDRLGPPDPAPRLRERSENRIRSSIALAHLARRHGVRRPDTTKVPPITGEFPRHGGVTNPAVRPVIAADENGMRIELRRQLRDLLDRVADADHQPCAASVTNRLIEHRQAVVKVRPPRCARSGERRVDHEHGDDIALAAAVARPGCRRAAGPAGTT